LDDAAATYVPVPDSVTIPAPIAPIATATAAIATTVVSAATVVSAVAVASATRLVALLGWLGSDGDHDDRARGQRAAGLYGQHRARRLRRRWHPRQARPQAQPAQVGEHHAGLLADQAGAADQDHRW
jgi:hypothetical protein